MRRLARDGGAASRTGEPVIGLEVHVRLRTESKMFGTTAAEFGRPPNTLTDPMVLGLPGALPTVNERAVELGLRLAVALGCEINETSRFARKHYFYPDLAKGYQITQHLEPLAEAGQLVVETHSQRLVVEISRLHLEEDSAKSSHRRGPQTLVDFNRAGDPLVELVTEPCLRSPDQAVAFLKELREILRYLEVSDGDMEKGSLRCDANVSVRDPSSGRPGPRREIKNLNSFRNLRDALAYEIDGRLDSMSRGEKTVQATVLWDERRRETRVTRTKETAPDYRYLPEPDLGALRIDPGRVAAMRASLGELPSARKERFRMSFGLGRQEASVLCGRRELASYFEEVVGAGVEPGRAASWVLTEVLRLEKGRRGGDPLPVAPASLARLLGMVERGELTARAAKQALELMYVTGCTVTQGVEESAGGKTTVDRESTAARCREVVESHPDLVEAYLAGKRKLLRFFVGRVMKKDPSQDPKLVKSILVDVLEKKQEGR